MKRSLKTVMACTIVLLVMAGMVSFANAGGGIWWKTKVTNKADVKISVTLTFGAFNYGIKQRDISPGDSYTFETGADCPVGMSGFAHIPHIGGSGKNIAYMCIIGLENASILCSPICANTEWTITKHSDGTYHFDKI